MPYLKPTLAQLQNKSHNLLGRLVQNGECLEYVGGDRKNEAGHRRLTIKIDGVLYRITAHKAAYMLHHGAEVPKGMVVRHTCDNPPCCNPEHLILGTQAQNVGDMMARGRWRNQHTKAA